MSHATVALAFFAAMLVGVRFLTGALKRDAPDNELGVVGRRRPAYRRAGMPTGSLVALLYPVMVMGSLARTPVPWLLILSYGFMHLGALLAVASLVPGHFRILGLDDRMWTAIAAGAFMLCGVALSNVGVIALGNRAV